MSDVDQKLLDRVQKLLALAESDNEHEAALALGKAQALMAEHNITLGRLKLNDVGETHYDSKVSISVVKPYELALMNLVAKAFGCKLLRRKGQSFGPGGGYITARWIFVGPKHQLAIVEWTAKTLADRLLKARGRYVKGCVGKRNEVANQGDSYCLGWVISLSRKVFDMAGAADWEAAIEEYLETKIKPEGEAKPKEQNVDVVALLAGRLDGNEESIHRPMEGGPSQLQIGG